MKQEHEQELSQEFYVYVILTLHGTLTYETNSWSR